MSAVPNQTLHGTEFGRVIKLLRGALDIIRPEPHASISEVRLEGRSIAVIQVEPSRQAPVFAQGAAYRRAQATDRPMSPVELRQQLDRAEVPIDKQLESLAQSVATLTSTIDELRQQSQMSGSVKTRLIEWILSGIIGAILGQLLTMLLGR